MHCTLHIGVPKTGTSSIQKFLDMNRGVLSRLGYIYTKSLGKTCNIRLHLLAHDFEHPDDMLTQYKLHSPQELRKFKEYWTSQLVAELDERISERTKMVVFSSEYLVRLNKEEIRDLKDLLNKCGMTSFSVVVYMRDQFSWALSSSSDAVKSGAVNVGVMPPTNPYVQGVCDYQQVILRWADSFGLESVIPRIFDKESFHKGNLIADFLSALGVSENPEFVYPKRENAAFSLTQAKLMAKVNRQLPRFEQERPNPLRCQGMILDALDSMSFQDAIGGKHAKAYARCFEESNEWVRLHYFPQRRQLFSNHVEKTDVQPDQDHMLDQFSVALTTCFTKYSLARNTVSPRLLIKCANIIQDKDAAGAYCLLCQCLEFFPDTSWGKSRFYHFESVIDKYFMPQLSG